MFLLLHHWISPRSNVRGKVSMIWKKFVDQKKKQLFKANIINELFNIFIAELLKPRASKN